ncbi:MAG: sterol desaturase family protein [Acidimicrobiales bacterium]
MFESALLDRLSRVHPAVPPALFVPAIAATFALGKGGMGPFAVSAWLIGGYAFWTLTEYWMHRIVFHFEPQGGLAARLHWIIHGVHHDHPNDPLRLVMPPSASVPLAFGFYGLFHLVIGGPSADLFASGFLAGYLLYDMAHYRLHHRPARTGLGRLLYEMHMRHHFQDDTRGFGVSSPFWDHVFGTPPRRQTKAISRPAGSEV